MQCTTPSAALVLQTAVSVDVMPVVLTTAPERVFVPPTPLSRAQAGARDSNNQQVLTKKTCVESYS